MASPARILRYERHDAEKESGTRQGQQQSGAGGFAFIPLQQLPGVIESNRHYRSLFELMVTLATGLEREIVALGVGKFHSHGFSQVLSGTRGHSVSFPSGNLET